MMEAADFLEEEYQQAKATWNLPPVDPRWKKFMVETLKKYKQPTSDQLDAIRAEGKVMATCNNFVSKMAGKSNEGYKDAYMKGLEFALNKIDNS